MKDVALDLLKAGVSVTPIESAWKDADSKEYSFPWRRYQDKRMTAGAAEQMFDGAWGICAVTGKISGGILCIDFDTPGGFELWKAEMESAGFSLDGCYIEKSLRGGHHVIFGWHDPENVPGNKKLARLADKKTAIETRGEGGLLFIAPTPGYERVAGDLKDVERKDEAWCMGAFAIARGFDETPDDAPKLQVVTRGETAIDTTRPGDVFNEEANWADILGKAGHKLAYVRGQIAYWTRAGKSHGVSMTTGMGRNGQDLLYVFSSNCSPLEEGECYSKFGAFALLEHGGDWGKATKAAADQFHVPSRQVQRSVVRAAAPVAVAEQPAVGGGISTIDWDFNCSDLGNAQRLVVAMEGKWRWSQEEGGWRVWDGKRYRLDKTGQSARNLFVTKVIPEMYRVAGDESVADAERTAIGTWAYKCEAKAKVDAAVELSKSLTGVAVSVDEMDTDPWLFNAQNGVIDLRTGKLLSHSPDRLITKVGGCEYDESLPLNFSKCPTFGYLLNHAFGDDPDTMTWLMRYFGYTLTGVVTEQIFGFIHGRAQTGKSTTVEVMSDIMGDYHRMLPTDSLMIKRNGGGIPSDIATLNKARMVTVEETEDGQCFASGLIKQLTGTAQITTRFMYGEYFDMPITFKLCVVGNEQPQVTNFDEPMLRRLNVIPFDNTIPNEKRDRNVKEKLRQEMPAILRLLVDSCLDWQRDGIVRSDSMVKALEKYHKSMDKIGTFLSERTEEEYGGRVKSSELYRCYKAWAEDNGFRPMSSTLFGTRIEGRLEKVRSNGMFYCDIRILEDYS